MKRLLKNIGEFGLIEYIRKNTKTDSTVVKGIGDDCAVLEFTKDRYLLVTVDMLLENVHFSLKKATGFQIGRKALACGLSDIAAMGGMPRYALVSLGVPAKTDFKLIKEIYRGINNLASKFKVNIIGGDTNSSKNIVIDLTVIGEVKKKNLSLRSGAKEGDIIIVSGKLGGSIYGHHLNFMPRIREAQFLVNNFKINSMIDISDGLSSDLHHIIKESKKGAVIFESLIPRSPKAKSFTNALNDGEDFELLFTMPPSDARRLFQLDSKFKKLFTPIGTVIKDMSEIILVNGQGKTSKLSARGFAHF